MGGVMTGKLMTLTACIALAASGSSLAATLQHPSARVAAQGETKITATLGGTRVAVQFFTHKVDIGKPSDEPPKRRMSSCTYSRIPCSLTDAVEISVAGHPVFVPRSAFADLADINGAELHLIAPGRFRLALTGGDASEAYEANIVFDRHRVRERTVTASEAQMVAEKTVYFDVSRAFVD